jgi:hypothetical protein
MNRKLLFSALLMSAVVGFSSLSAKTAGENDLRSEARIKPSPQRINILKNMDSNPTSAILAGGVTNVNNTNGGLEKQSKVKTVSDLSKFEGRVLYGNMVSSKPWLNMTITDVPYGFYSFTIDNSASPKFTPLYTGIGRSYISGAYSKGKFYGVRPVSTFGVLIRAFHEVINSNPWSLEKILMIGDDSKHATYDALASSMVYDKTNDQIYALEYNEDLTGLYWSTYNKKTLSFDVITKWKANFDALVMAATPDGSIYCVSTSGDFYSIDKETGRPSLIGSTGVAPRLYSQSAVYDGKTGTILWFAVTANGNNLYSINITTGEASFIRTFPEENQMVGLYSNDNEAVDNAPAAVNDLKVTYSKSGDLGATINFTAPTQTYAGQTLTGNINLRLWVDGEMIKDESVAPGKSYSIPYSFTRDNHYIAVTSSNTAGMSPYCNQYFFVGYDNPKAVQNLSYSIENGNSKLIWDAPAGGVNAGYINPDSVFYKVYRYPGNVLVADNLKSTNFSETMPTEMQNYFYSVTAYNGKNNAGVVDTTNVINYGTGFPVPYVQTFEATDALKFFTIYDGNNDKMKWTYNTNSKWVSVNTLAGKKVSSDWLITPRMRLNSGVKYKLTFAVKGFSTYPENLKVLLGTNPLDTLTFNTTMKDMPNMVIANFQDQNIEFSVASAGDYAVGFYAYSDYTKSSMIAINKIKVDVVGNIGAPDSVSNLTITRNPNDELAATIAFTTPSKNLDNESISSISKVNIFRDEATEPVYTFDAPATNVQLSWTDTNVPKAAITKYRVVAENENGKGKISEVSDFIGVYTSPYIETFDNSSVFNLYKKTTSLTGATGWIYDATAKALTLNNFFMDLGDFNLYSPAIKLEGDAVYQFGFKLKNGGYGKATYTATQGMSTIASEQTSIGQLAAANFTKFTETKHNFITTDAGKYYVGINVQANAQYDYVSLIVDSIYVKKISSARVPGTVKNLSVKPDPNGVVASQFSFNAPDVDYAGRTLTTISKIEVFRGQNSIPVKIFSQPTPGELVTWIDDQPYKGVNTYSIIASNEYGIGSSIQDTLFVGYDIPKTINNLVIKADANNQKPTLTWTAPNEGVNGGLVDSKSLKYKVLEYNPVTKLFTTLAENISDLTYTIDIPAKTKQDVFYYGVVAMTNEGNANVVLSYVALGPLFKMPFKETFANATSATEPWITNAELTYAYWTPTAPVSGGVAPQDGDGGMVVYYNSGYNALIKGDLTSPKIAVSGNSAKLRFWLYQGIPTQYTNTPPYVSASVSTNGVDFTKVLDDIYINIGAAGWVEHTINLTDLNGASFVQFRFNAFTAGKPDIIYIDNISLEENGESGVESGVSSGPTVQSIANGIVIKGAYGQKVDIYNVSGQKIATFTALENEQRTLLPGIYLIKVNDKVFKTIVK